MLDLVGNPNDRFSHNMAHFNFSGLTILDGHVYAIGGWDGNSRLDSVESYDPGTNSWSFIPPMKMALTSPAVATLRGFLYVTGLYTH